MVGIKLSVFYSRPLVNSDVETGKSDNSEPTPFTEESKLFPFLLKAWGQPGTTLPVCRAEWSSVLWLAGLQLPFRSFRILSARGMITWTGDSAKKVSEKCHAKNNVLSITSSNWGALLLFQDKQTPSSSSSPQFKHHFPAPSSKLCQNWLRHWRALFISA